MTLVKILLEIELNLAHESRLLCSRCLYLAKNMIEDIDGCGLSSLVHLDSLDLADNYIKALPTHPSSHQEAPGGGLCALRLLRNLNLSGNKIQDVEGLRHLAVVSGSLTSLDLSGNRIHDEASVDFFAQGSLPSLSLLRLVGNPIVGSYRSYRKRLLSTLPNLNYLDESPCFPKVPPG